jgi:hypothetical protein
MVFPHFFTDAASNIDNSNSNNNDLDDFQQPSNLLNRHRLPPNSSSNEQLNYQQQQQLHQQQQQQQQQHYQQFDHATDDSLICSSAMDPATFQRLHQQQQLLQQQAQQQEQRKCYDTYMLFLPKVLSKMLKMVVVMSSRSMGIMCCACYSILHIFESPGCNHESSLHKRSLEAAAFASFVMEQRE